LSSPEAHPGPQQQRQRGKQESVCPVPRTEERPQGIQQQKKEKRRRRRKRREEEEEISWRPRIRSMENSN